MGRYKQAPWGFECPYKDDCPHLGMSTRWASLLISDIHEDRFRESHALMETEKENNLLREEIRTLQARVLDLETRLLQKHRQQFKPNRSSKRATHSSRGRQKRGKGASNSSEQPAPRKRGAPKGHPPWQRRTPDHVDRSIDVPAPHACPHCKTPNLQPVDKTHVQLQEDIVLQPRTLVTQYTHHLAFCPCCRREVFQVADGELRNCEIGPLTKAVAVYLRHEVKLSYRDIRKVFSGLFGMPFVPASAMAFSHRIARQGRHLYEDLRDKIRAAEVVHGDETHWRVDGTSAYLWYAGNPQFAFFHIDPSRSSEVARSIFGDHFPGNLVADSYAAYNAIKPRRRQACLSHLIRAAKDIAERLALLPAAQRDESAGTFCNAIQKFFAICCRIDQRRSTGRLHFSRARKHLPRLQRTLGRICSQPLAEPDAENLRRRLTEPKRDAPHLFTFLDVHGMPPTNNHAEQSLRRPVIFRKLCFGNRSLLGADALAVNLSLLLSATRQQLDPIQLFANILLRGPQIPPNFIFQPEESTAPNDSS